MLRDAGFRNQYPALLTYGWSIIRVSVGRSFRFLSGHELPASMRFASALTVVQQTTHARWNTAHGASNRNCVLDISIS
jgi:hypothetical protein